MDVSPHSSWRVRRPTRLPEKPETNGLLEEGVDALPVRVVIEQNDWVTGWDEGALGFDDDALWYSGRACSFRIVARDLSARMPQGFAFVETRRAVVLRHPSRDLVLRFEVLSLAMRRDWEDEERLARGLARLAQRPASEGESEYPPLRLRPGSGPIDAPEWTNARLRSSLWTWPFSRRRSFRPISYLGKRDDLLRALAQESV